MNQGYRRWTFQLYLGFISFVLIASSLQAAPAEQRTPKSWRISYYSRKLDQPAYAMLCLTTRIAKNPLLFGHSAISEFKLSKKRSDTNRYRSSSVRTAGFHQYRRPQTINGRTGKLYLQYDSADDYFLAFTDLYPTWSINSRHCVPITKSESQRMWNWLDTQREKTWLLTFNCNDIATQAFRLGSGLDFSKVFSHYLISTPDILLAAVKRYQEPIEPAGAFTHTPKTKSEIKLLTELEETNRLTVSPFL